MEFKSSLSTSVVRRKRLSAVSARMASQPYPAITQRTQEWIQGLGDEPQMGKSNVIEGSSTTAQENFNPALAGRWDQEGYGEQSALAEALLFPNHTLSTRDVRMKDAWESTTVASTMHTASMLDWNDGASEGTMRPSKKVREDWSPPPEKEEGECDDEGSVYAPSSRSVTPPRRVSPRKVKKHTTRRATLDEDYDEENTEPAISGGASIGQNTLDDEESYLPSSTAVESKNHSLF
jgi:hypothetical protein